MDDIIQQLAAQKLGPAPGAPPAPPTGAQQAGAPAAPPAPPKADPSPTAQEQALAKASPKAADGAAGEASITLYDIPDEDGKTRQMTPQQIKSTMDRYSDLNYKWQNEHAPVKPVVEVARQIMDAAKAAGKDVGGEDVAKLIKAAVQAYVSNPTMGQQTKKLDSKTEPTAKAPMSPPSNDGDDDAGLSQWEKDNAVSLPPGYKESMKGTKALQSQMTQLMQMMSQLAASGQMGAAGVQQGQQAQQAAQGQQVNVAKQAIQTNMKAAFAQNGIAPDAAQDFFIFAQQRGYSPEDFIDPSMAATVAADYKANKDAPEVQRLREIAQRRQAFTGQVDGSPGGAAGGTPAAGADPFLSQLIGSAVASRAR